MFVIQVRYPKPLTRPGIASHPETQGLEPNADLSIPSVPRHEPLLQTLFLQSNPLSPSACFTAPWIFLKSPFILFHSTELIIHFFARGKKYEKEGEGRKLESDKNLSPYRIGEYIQRWHDISSKRFARKS
jgi:hypothetical protein